MKKTISLLLSLIFLFSLFNGCSINSQQKYSKSFTDLFDTASTIVAYDDSQDSFNNNYIKIHKKLLYYSKLFDIYKDYNNIINLKYVNDNAGIKPVKVSDELFEFIKICKDQYKSSNYKVNIALGSILNIWHSYMENGIANPKRAKLPNLSDLKEANKHTNIDNIILNDKNKTIFFKDKNLKIDCGAIAKGYVCDKIYDYIIKNDIWSSAIITLGGNVKTIGDNLNSNDNYYTIAIDNDSNGYIACVKVKEGESVITSSSFQRYYKVNGKIYSHIIDVNTLMPANNIKSVSVISKDSTLGDTMSTALFCMSLKEGKKLVESKEEVEAIWLTNDNKVIYSSGVNLA